jgi:phosphoribulokinase
VPDKVMRMTRAGHTSRPVMIAIAGDSAAGKTTLTQGLFAALGQDRCTSVCVDDYHRYDRDERAGLPFTALHPDCNYIDIMEQQLQLLAMGQPILKPSYDHTTGTFTRHEYVEPREFVFVEGLLPLSTKLLQACFDVSVYLDPPEPIRREWKVARDTATRGYTAEAVLAELERREPESEAFIRPQRRNADIVVRFAPIPGRDDPPETPLSAELLLRPTIRHPPMSDLLTEDHRWAMHMKIRRDAQGAPVDALHVHGYATPAQTEELKRRIWAHLDVEGDPPTVLGELRDGRMSEPLALTQLLLLYHAMAAQARHL